VLIKNTHHGIATDDPRLKEKYPSLFAGNNAGAARKGTRTRDMSLITGPRCRHV
jgi:hypothetical protein